MKLPWKLNRLSSLLRRWKILRARWDLRAGKIARSRQRLEAMLVRDPTDFDVHVLLAQVALEAGDGSRGVQELAVCHLLNPDRFETIPMTADLRMAVLERTLGRPGDHLAASNFGPTESWIDDGSRSNADSPVLEDDSGWCQSDFSGRAEWERFQSRPPITSADLATVDWNGLLQQLADASPHGEPRRTVDPPNDSVD